MTRPGKLSFPNDASGVSLVELLIVVSVMGTIALVAYPRLVGSVEDGRLNAAAAKVTAAVGYAKLKAMNSGLPTQVEVNTSSDVVKLKQIQPPDEISDAVPFINAAVVEGGLYKMMMDPSNPGEAYVVPLAGQGLFGGIDIVGADFGGSLVLDFDALGTPSSGGTVTLACGRDQKVLHVDALTGKVTVTP